MTAPADGTRIDAGSPETPPAARPSRGGGRGRLGPVLRLACVGSLVAALLQPVALGDWAAQRPLLAQSSSVQTAIEEIDQVHATISFPRAYEWLRRQTRALQAWHFSADAGNQQ